MKKKIMKSTTTLFFFLSCLTIGSTSGFTASQQQSFTLSSRSVSFLVDPVWNSCYSSRRCRKKDVVCFLFADDEEDDAEDVLTNFNPFEKRNTKSSNASSFLFANSQISPRQMQMQEVMSELLRFVDDEDQVQQILQTKKDFLLEPLMNDTSFLEKDSIYTSEMTKQERFQRYNQVMEERINKASSPAATKILTSMRNFIMSYSP